MLIIFFLVVGVRAIFFEIIYHNYATEIFAIFKHQHILLVTTKQALFQYNIYTNTSVRYQNFTKFEVQIPSVISDPKNQIKWVYERDFEFGIMRRTNMKTGQFSEDIINTTWPREQPYPDKYRTGERLYMNSGIMAFIQEEVLTNYFFSTLFDYESFYAFPSPYFNIKIINPMGDIHKTTIINNETVIDIMFDEINSFYYYVTKSYRDQKIRLSYQKGPFSSDRKNITQFPALWAVLAMNSTVIVFQDQVTYNLSYYYISNQTIEENVLDLQNPHIVKDRINETFIVFGIPGELQKIILFDLEEKRTILLITISQNLACSRFKSILYWDYHIVVRNKCQKKSFIILKIQPQISHTFYETKVSCTPPYRLVQNKYCLLCPNNCQSCQPFKQQICTQCAFGHILQSDLTCKPATFTISFYNFLSFPLISSVFLFMENYFKFLDNVWLFQFHNIAYSENVKSLLQYIRKANQAKFFPTFIEKSKEPLVPPPQNSARGQFTFKMYKNIIGKNAYFLGNAEDMYLWGTLSTVATLFLFFLIAKFFKKTVLIVFFGRYQSFAFCLSQIIEPRISNTSFLFFTEIQASASVDYREKASLILCTLYFFIILFYTMNSYIFYRYFYGTKDKTAVMCKIFKNFPRTFFFFTYCNIQLILQAFAHSFLHDWNQIQIGVLMVITVVGFFVIIKCHQIFESVLHFFIYIFYYVSRLLFLFSLWLSIRGQTQILTVDLDLVSTIFLLLLFIFSLLKIISNLIIFTSRLFNKFKDFLKKRKQEKEENEKMAALLEEESSVIETKKKINQNVVRFQKVNEAIYKKYNLKDKINHSLQIPQKSITEQSSEQSSRSSYKRQSKKQSQSSQNSSQSSQDSGQNEWKQILFGMKNKVQPSQNAFRKYHKKPLQDFDF